MDDDRITVTINLVWNDDTQAWIPRTTFINLGEKGQKSASSKPTPSRILTLQSGEEYQSDKKAYEVSWSRALDRIKKECGVVPIERIRVIVKKEIAGKSEHVQLEDLK